MRDRLDVVGNLVELSRFDCEELLRSHVVGRVSVATREGPHIVPVNYCVVDGPTAPELIIRTTPYSVLGSHGDGATLAFEIDHFDYPHRRGWSVVVRGRATVLRDAVSVARVLAMWPPQPWAGGHRHLLIRLPFTEVSGRRIGAGWNTDGGRSALAGPQPEAL